MISPLIKRLQSVVEKYPDQPAIIHKNSEITFSELDHSIKKMAAWLSARGVEKGERVLVFIPMRIELYILLLALWRLGAIAVFVDAWTTKNRLTRVQEIARCSVFIGSLKAHLLRVIQPGAFKHISKSFFLPDPGKLKNVPIMPAADVDENETALITFTTGSTGVPKGADRSHAFLMAQNAVLEKHLQLRPGSMDLTTLPIFVLNNLAGGIGSVLPPINFSKPDKVDPAKVIAIIKRYNIESSAGSPFFYERLAKYCKRKAEMDVPLKKIFIGGAAVFPELVEKIQSTMPGVSLEIVYGSTEAEPISAFSPEGANQSIREVFENGLFVGKPVEAINLKIISMEQSINPKMSGKEFEALCMADGTPGEICVAGKHVLQKYVRNEAAQRENKIDVDGIIWHRTGDAGYLDSNGKLFLLGRVKQRIRIGDSSLFVFPYENYFSTMEHVRLGTLLESKGEIIVVLELEKSGRVEKIRAELQKLNLAFRYKTVFAKIPRDPRHNSKIDYHLLKKAIG